MTAQIETVQEAQRRGSAARPRVDGFPYFAEALRVAGITAVETSIATGGSVYHLDDGAVVQTFDPVVGPVASVPAWDEGALIAAVRANQSGRTTYPEFLRDAWAAGVIHYRVDLAHRTCTYVGLAGSQYIETYPAVAALN